MFCGPHNPCATCLPNYQPKEAVVTEKKDRCWLCAIEVKPDEDGEWNGYINDEGTVYCYQCDPDRPDDIQFTERDDCYDDAEADGEALASAGWGTDEDYGYFGGDE